MSWILEIFLGLCVLTLCGGLTVWLMGKSSQESKSPAKCEKVLEEVQNRLDQVDRRLTDVQDVMITLSEKFDRWEVDRLGV